MIKKLGLTTATLSILLLSGCGGGGSKNSNNTSNSNTNQLKAKHAIVIYHNMTKGSCISTILKPNYLINPIIFEEANNVSCEETYGRPTTSDLKGAYCREEETEYGGDVSCVVGFDDYGSAALNKKYTNSYTTYIFGDMPIL